MASMGVAVRSFCRQVASPPRQLQAWPTAARALSSKPNPANSPYQLGAHRSNAEELVAQYPVIEVEGTVALCDGGGGALGHPIEFIQLNNVLGEVAICKYCGLRYKAKYHH